MAEVPRRPPKGQAPDIEAARDRLHELIQAGHAFMDAWHQNFEVGRNPPYVGWVRDMIDNFELWEESFNETAEFEAYLIAPLDFDEPAQVRTWLKDVDTQIEDVFAAGEDATRPPGKRTLGRPLARMKIMEARRSLRELMFAARKGMDPQASL